MALRNREVHKVTATVLGSTFGWSVTPRSNTSGFADAIRIGSSVRISGFWDGEISVFLTPELARRAAVVTSQAPTRAVNESQIRESVRKIAGQIGADLRDLLPNSCELHVATPATISGGTIRTTNMSTLVDCDGEACWVLVDGSTIEDEQVSAGPSRRFSRAEVALGVTVSAAGTIHRSVGPNNLSMNGVFVRGESSIPRGRDCVVKVHLGEGPDEESVQVTGRVVRVTPEGFAVEFLEVDLDSYRQLRDLVRLNSVEPKTNGTEPVTPRVVSGAE